MARMRWDAALGVAAGGGRDSPVLPTFKEGGVFREEDGLEAAPFWGIKTAPLGGERVREVVFPGQQLKRESVTKDGDHLCVWRGKGGRRQMGTRFALPGQPGMRGMAG